MTPCRSKISETRAEYQAEICTNMYKLYSLSFFSIWKAVEGMLCDESNSHLQAVHQKATEKPA